MYSVAAIALSALVMVAAAPSAFAEDRSVKVDDSRQTDGEIFTSEVAAAGRAVDAAEAKAPSLSACHESTPAPDAPEACQGGRQNSRSLTRRIDWSAVGPSADDFATTDNTLRLQGARLVGSFKF